MTSIRTLGLVALAMVACACGGLTAPSSGWNPGKPIDSNNRPPSPPATERQFADFTSGVSEGDCTANPAACGPAADPSNLPPFVLHTHWVCAAHPRWGERTLRVSSLVTIGRVVAREEREDRLPAEPFCTGQSFQLMPEQAAEAIGEGSETGWDILSPRPPYRQSLTLRAGRATGPPPTSTALVATPDTFEVGKGCAREIGAPGVLANDTFPAGSRPGVEFSAEGLDLRNRGGTGAFRISFENQPGFEGAREARYFFNTGMARSEWTVVTFQVRAGAPCS